ncbi:MAG: class I SAM-dependent methyltransferase [Thermaurantiacus sp.]
MGRAWLVTAAIGTLAILSVGLPAHAQGRTATQQDVAALLDAAVAGDHRSPEARARDGFRNPKETLIFFGLQPNMTVVEVTPAAGWYTDILAPVLRERGRYVAAHFNRKGTEGQQRSRQAFIDRVKARPEVYGSVAVTSFGRGIASNIAAPGSADMVLTFRNVHNWVGAGFADEAFQAFYTALRPGGILGVVEHRLPEDRPDDEKSRASGYMKQSEVIRMAEAAGFRLVEASEINANPRDTADHPRGVWTLPPTLALGDQDRDTYVAIGESDRMTLKFVKPGG